MRKVLSYTRLIHYLNFGAVFRPHDSFKDTMLHNIVRDAFVMMANSPLNFIYHFTVRWRFEIESSNFGALFALGWLCSEVISAVIRENPIDYLWLFRNI